MKRFQLLVLALMKSPVVWGGAASVAFYALLEAGFLGQGFVRRYCATNSIQYAEMVVFFIGLAALLVKAADVGIQFRIPAEPLLGPMPATGRPVGDARPLVARLDRLPLVWQEGYLVRRLRKVLDHLLRRGSAESLDDELKYQAAMDSERMHGSYSMIRLIIWAVPILGFLGTVVGITMAIASLKMDAVQESMMEVTSGLGVKFDTTAQALSLSMILMLVQYFVDRLETRLLAAVDRRVEDELVGRFLTVPADGPGQVAALERANRAIVESLEALAGHVQRTMTQNAHALASLAAAVREKTDALERAGEAATELARLEESLNRNLSAVAGAGHFEETVTSLAAAVQLLSARLGTVPAAPATIQLQRPRRAAA